MTRRFYIGATAITVGTFIAAFVTAAVIEPAPRLLWNASPSAPLGLYAVRPVLHPPRGVLVVVRPPQRLAAWLAARHYLPEGVPLLKHVVATSGQRACRTGARLSVDGKFLAEASRSDSGGRPLPVWRGCQTLRPDQLLIMNPSVPDSLDGRYFGPLPAAVVIGRAVPILTRDPKDGRFHWRLARH